MHSDKLYTTQMHIFIQRWARNIRHQAGDHSTNSLCTVFRQCEFASCCPHQVAPSVNDRNKRLSLYTTVLCNSFRTVQKFRNALTLLRAQSICQTKPKPVRDFPVSCNRFDESETVSTNPSKPVWRRFSRRNQDGRW